MQILLFLLFFVLVGLALQNLLSALKYEPGQLIYDYDVEVDKDSPRKAQNLIFEQVALWEFKGPRTGAYYAKQQAWTVRARAYVADLKKAVEFQK